MRKLIIFLMVFSLIFMSVAPSVFGAYANVGPTTEFQGDVGTTGDFMVNGTKIAFGDVTNALGVTMANVGSTAINAHLIPDSANDTNLGSTTYEWLEIYISDDGHLYLGSGQDTNIARNAADTMTLTASEGVITSDSFVVGGTLVVGSDDIVMSGSLATTGVRVTKGWFTDLEVTNTPSVGGTALSSIYATVALDNLASVAINDSLTSDSYDVDGLGSATKEWKDLFIGELGKIYLGIAQDTNLQRTASGVLTLTAASGVITSAGLTVGGDITLGANSIGRDADNDIDFETDNQITFRTQGTDVITIDSAGVLAMGAHDIDLTGSIGRDADNELNWGNDNQLNIVINGTTHSIVGIDTGAGDNDTLVTQGYVDDSVVGAARNYVEHFMDVHATDSDYCHAQMEGGADSQPITTAITSPDVPRNLEVTFSATEDSESGVVTVTGTLAAGTAAQTETFEFTSDSVVVGTKAFATISKIFIPAGSMNGIEIDVGIGDLLGLSNAVSAEGDVYKITLDSIDSSVVVSGNVDTTYNTVDCSDVVDNSDYTVWYHN